MITELKFRKETHMARNGTKIDFIGYYPDYSKDYPYGVMFADGVTESIAENGKVWDSDDDYDLVFLSPFMPETHIREDGVEIDSWEILPQRPESVVVYFKDEPGAGSYYDKYTGEGQSAMHRVITREEYAKRKQCPFSAETHIRADGVEITEVDGRYEVGFPWLITFADAIAFTYPESGAWEGIADHLPIITREEYAALKAAEPFTVDNCRTELCGKLEWLAQVPENLVKSAPTTVSYIGILGGKVHFWNAKGMYASHFAKDQGFDLVKI